MSPRRTSDERRSNLEVVRSEDAKSDEGIARKKRKNGRIPEWPNGADCKSAGLYLRWFESIFSQKITKGLKFVSG